MNRDIINQLVKEMQEVIKGSLVEGLKKGHIGDLNLYFRKEWNKLGCQLLGEIYTDIDKEIYKRIKKTKKYKVIKKDKKVILTSIGEVSFTKRLYRDKNGSEYLFDKKMQIRKGARYTVDAEAKILEEAYQTSYRKGGENIGKESKVTKQTVMNMLKDLVIPERDYVVTKKKKVEYLYIEADEDHINLQREKKFSEINKLIYVHEGIEPDAPKSERKHLINPHYFGGINTKKAGNIRLWRSVRRYIEEVYDLKSVKMIYLSGDGGPWIQEGMNIFERMTFVMDEFHVMERINQMTNHLKDSQEDAKSEMYRLLHRHDFTRYENFIEKLYSTITNKSVNKIVKDADTYFRSFFDSICLRYSKDERILGCSAEGHVSHILASRMSSRPMGWTIEGANKMTKLRLYKINGGDIYDLVCASDIANQAVTFKNEEQYDYYGEYSKAASSVIMGVRRQEKELEPYKYWNQMQASITNYGKTMLEIHHIKY